jgi:hypothetical protein
MKYIKISAILVSLFFLGMEVKSADDRSGMNYVPAYGYVPHHEEHHLNPNAPIEQPDNNGNYKDGSHVVVDGNIRYGSW